MMQQQQMMQQQMMQQQQMMSMMMGGGDMKKMNESELSLDGTVSFIQASTNNCKALLYCKRGALRSNVETSLESNF